MPFAAFICALRICRLLRGFDDATLSEGFAGAPAGTPMTPAWAGNPIVPSAAARVTASRPERKEPRRDVSRAAVFSAISLVPLCFMKIFNRLVRCF